MSRARLARGESARQVSGVCPLFRPVRAILGQQVSVGAARNLAAKLVEAYGEPVDDPVAMALGLTRAFPRPERLAGRPYDRATVVRRLEQVGATVSGSGSDDGTILVVPPSWRPDLTRPADLVEEVARLEGYDTIESVLPVAPAGTGLTGTQRRTRSISADLASAGTR